MGRTRYLFTYRSKLLYVLIKIIILAAPSLIHCHQRVAAHSSRLIVEEKVFPLQWVTLSVPTYRHIKICPPSQKDESLLFLDMLPNRAYFRVPLNSAPAEIDPYRTMQAPICVGNRWLSQAQSCHLYYPNRVPFGTALVPAFIPRANCMNNLQLTQTSTSHFTCTKKIKSDVRMNASLSHNALAPLFHSG